MELIQTLIEQLGVNEAQAKGGTGLLFQLAKSKLDANEFQQISAGTPGIDEFVNDAPESHGLMGSLGDMASTLGGKMGGLGDLAGLASGFSKLGLDKGMIGKFIPVVLSFVQSQGGDTAKGLLEKVLSPQH